MVTLLIMVTNTWSMSEEEIAKLSDVELRRASEVIRYERLAAEKKKREGCCGGLLSCLSKKNQDTGSHEEGEEMENSGTGQWRTNPCFIYTPPTLIKPFEEWELSELIEEAIKEEFYKDASEMTDKTQEALKRHLVDLLNSRHQGWN